MLMSSSNPLTQDFFAALREQRWDDHRYYHQSRINQSLHLLSALLLPWPPTAMLFVDPVLAAIRGVALAPWCSRQMPATSSSSPRATMR